MPTPCWLKHLCSIRALVPVFFSLSLSLTLFLFQANFWSAEALSVPFPAQGSRTLLRRHSAPSPPREGIWGLHEQSKCRVRDFIGFMCKLRNISLVLPPLLSYRRPQTTRFRSIKGPQQRKTLDLEETPSTVFSPRFAGEDTGWARLSGMDKSQQQIWEMAWVSFLHILSSSTL